MKKQWILYIIALGLIMGVTIHSYAASQMNDAEKRALDLAADYQVLADSVSSPGMNAGRIVIEVRLAVDGMDERTLAAILDELPPKGDTAIVSDRFHGVRWLHVTCISAADSIYEDALAMLSPFHLDLMDGVQISLNASWHTTVSYSPAEKENLIRSIFASMDARASASMSDGRMVSASGLSPSLSSCAGKGINAMNITASLCADHSGGSTLWLGTPVLTVEY